MPGPPRAFRFTMASHSGSRSRVVLIGAGILALLGIAVGAWAAVSTSRTQAAEEPPVAALPDATTVGAVELNVSNLDLMRAYYQDAVGLQILDQTDDTVTLGDEAPVLRLLTGAGGAEYSTPTDAGLYHSAILYPDEASLARVMLSIATVAPQSYQGAADHAVSLAFYFVDPEGNGLELYVDTPEEEWVWEDGEVQMGSEYLDPNAFIEEHLDGSSAPSEMGHVHLKVGDLAEAEAFYADTLGFAVTARSEGALFYSAGGYHHHIATNVWQSQGAGERQNSTGLASLSVRVPDAAALAAAAERLDAAGVDFERSGDELVTADPWGNTVIVSVD